MAPGRFQIYENGGHGMLRISPSGLRQLGRDKEADAMLSPMLRL